MINKKQLIVVVFKSIFGNWRLNIQTDWWVFALAAYIHKLPGQEDAPSKNGERTILVESLNNARKVKINYRKK